MKTFVAKPDTIKRDWYVVDASGKTLGRLATEIATRLRGKHKPEYTPFADTGDYIIVVNAEKVVVTGNKTTDKMYHAHSHIIVVVVLLQLLSERLYSCFKNIHDWLNRLTL